MMAKAAVQNTGKEFNPGPYLSSVSYIIVLIWLTGIWVWPSSAEIEGINDTKPGGFILNVSVYFILLAHSVIACTARPMSDMAQAVAPIAPFVLYASFCALFGLDPMISLRALLLWLLPVICGVIFARLYRFDSLLALTARFLILSCILSITYQILSPQAASIQGYLRGLYTGKNIMGFIAAVAILVVFASRNRLGVAASLCGIVFSSACLALSGSRTSFLACLVSCAVHVAVTLKVSMAMRVTIICGLIFVMIVMTTFGFDIVLELLGKDSTLTGRTLIWNSFISEALTRPVFGAGPGTFTGITPITAPYREAFASFGDIQSPHNFFIVIAGEVGLPGLLLLLIFLARQITVALKNPSPRTALAASVAAFMVVEGMGESMGGFSPNILWMLFAITHPSDAVNRNTIADTLARLRVSHKTPVALSRPKENRRRTEVR